MLMATEDRVREYVAYSPGTFRGELAAELRLPAPTVVSAVRRLLSAGELVETEVTRARASAGRRPRVLRVSGPATLVGLVSWDGDGLRATCVDVEGAVVATRALAAPRPHAGIDGLRAAVDQVIALARGQGQFLLRTVVMSVPGPCLSGRGVPREPALGAPTFPVTVPGDLAAILSERCGLPVAVENDANVCALGELYRGGLRRHADAVSLIVTGHGFGSALIVNGALARGAQGYAGELPHLQVDREGPLCACGGRGCLLYSVRERVVASAQAAYAEPITFGDLPRLAATGDMGAARMLQDVGRALGGPLAHLCTFLDPEVLLVGGTLGPSAEHVVAGIREVLAVQAPPAVAGNVAVVRSTLGPAAELLGAIELGRLRARR
ncbi:ROK family protein [Actinoplanes sp. LDG1-06]|uniref:ROK family protein n=1 Tax=Paractinoplanes ovalisporus TaxID=2810368 RepID=A0ABS2A4W8_9ACTN|nr:ROK family protein [Actinoplanes ovalisporus]MBM2614876.1 ROK family protein [Actinoplanes ovalisporus]